MFLSKLWFFLVAVVAVASTTLLMLQPKPVQGELDAQLEARLQGADRGAGMLLKIHARKWLDASAQVSSDAQLYEALDQATRGAANLELVHKTAQTRLKYFNQEWKTDQLIAVDGKGKVVARTGLDEGVWKDDISGYPVVAEALRGYRLDDTWDMNGKVYRVTASPVIARDRYAGALLVVQEIGADLAGRIHDTLGVDVAFLVRGQVAAQSTSLPILGELAPLVKQHAAELAEKGHTDPIPLKGGDRNYSVVAAPLAGEAAAHDAAYVLIAERPLAATVSTTLSALSPSMMTGRDLGVLGGGLALLLALGFTLMSLEHDRPVRKLLRALQALSRGDGPRVDDTQHGGKFGGMARAVNATLDRLAQEKPAAPPERSIDAILGPPRLDAAPPLPPPRAPAAAYPPHEHESSVPTSPYSKDSPLDGTAPGTPLALGATENPTREIVGPRALAGIAAGGDTGSFNNEPPTKPHGRPLPHADMDSFDAPPTVLDTDGLSEKLAQGLSSDDESTKIAPADPKLIEQSRGVPTLETPTPGDSLAVEADFKAVFEEFIETKKNCGEPTEGVTFDKFVGKLRQNRDQLMARYACKSVKFQVYVKDGKAALKATPVQSK